MKAQSDARTIAEAVAEVLEIAARVAGAVAVYGPSDAVRYEFLDGSEIVEKDGEVTVNENE